LRARLPSAVNVFSAWKVWNQVHQQPPNTPLCRSASRALESSDLDRRVHVRVSLPD
jgi:hypothetical protein